MHFQQVLYFSISKLLVFLVFVISSPTVFAISAYVEAQSPQSVTALIYGLLGVMTLLFITPFLQFYFAAVRNVNHRRELDQFSRVTAENETLKHELEVLKGKLEQEDKNEPAAKPKLRVVAGDKEFAALERHNDAAQNQISALLSQVDSLKKRLYEKDQSIEILDHQLELLEAEQENATEFINKITEQLAAQKKAVAIAEQNNQSLTKVGNSEANNTLQSELDQLNSETMRKNDELLKEKAAVSDELAHTKLDLAKSKQQVNELSQTAQQLDMENKQQTVLIDNLMAQLAEKKDSNTK